MMGYVRTLITLWIFFDYVQTIETVDQLRVKDSGLSIGVDSIKMHSDAITT